jgi:tRNA threonylcarbamoyladenosine biosynthesis protein TsaE
MDGDYQSSSPQATRRLGVRLGRLLNAGDVVALIGELGAGKTCFVHGLAEGLEISRDVPIPSPTFTVVNTYHQGRVTLYHLDLYRLGELDELEAIGYRDFLDGEGVTVLEWADRVPGALPAKFVEVVIKASPAGNKRSIAIRRKPC